RDKAQRSGVHCVTLSGGRRWIGNQVSEVRIAALGSHFDAMHIVRTIILFDDRIFRDRFRKSWASGAAVKFVERRKKWFASDNVDINARSNVVPIFVLKRGLGAVLAGDPILVRLQARAECGVAWHRPVRIKPGGFFGERVRCEGKVEDDASRESGDTEPDTQTHS